MFYRPSRPGIYLITLQHVSLRTYSVLNKTGIVLGACFSIHCAVLLLFVIQVQYFKLNRTAMTARTPLRHSMRVDARKTVENVKNDGNWRNK